MYYKLKKGKEVFDKKHGSKPSQWYGKRVFQVNAEQHSTALLTTRKVRNAYITYLKEKGLKYSLSTYINI